MHNEAKFIQKQDNFESDEEEGDVSEAGTGEIERIDRG